MTMTENELLDHVTHACRTLKLRHWHDYDSRRNDPGLPDLVIVGPGGLIWRELKSAAGELSSAQVAWKWDLIAAGQNWKVWRPADWHDGTIMTELADLRNTP